MSFDGPIKPGDAIGVNFVTGDLLLGGTGTVTVGGLNANEGNTISGNGADGIVVFGCDQCEFYGNTIAGHTHIHFISRYDTLTADLCRRAP